MKHLSIDIETRGSEDLTKVGVHKYVKSSGFELLLFAYSIDFGEVQIVDVCTGEEIPDYIVEALYDDNVTKYAYNAQFERLALSEHFDREMDAIQWECTMVHTYMAGLSGTLKEVGEILNIDTDKKKQSVGTRLIKLFCVKGANPYDYEEDWELFKDYCIHDVLAEMEIKKKLNIIIPFSKHERLMYALDQQINDRGIPIDIQFVNNILELDNLNKETLLEEIKELTELENPNSPKQLKDWIEEIESVEVPSLAKTVINNMKFKNKKVLRALEIRGELSKTSLKKYTTLVNYNLNGRIYGQIQFYGAERTGRFAGRGIQVHNLPQNHIYTLDYARNLVASSTNTNDTVNVLRLLYGNVSNVLSELIRSSLKTDDGKTFVVADFSAIEARVIAWLSDETWRINVFNSHGKIYEASASEMFGVPIEEITKGSTLRQKGKIAELALGYGGGVSALTSMGALNMGLNEEELQPLVNSWRKANPNITRLWKSVENACISVIKGEPYRKVKHLEFMYKNETLYIKLPSGRILVYEEVRLVEGKFSNESIEYRSKSARTSTFGGKLVENIVQAISRDLLMLTLDRLKALDICFHVHDEVVIEVNEEESDDVLSYVLKVMAEPISWAVGLNLKGDGYITQYYKKD